MAAVSEYNDLIFRNVCGGIKLLFKGTDRIASIKIEGKNGEKLSGAAVVTAYTDETVPAIAMSDDASTSVTLNCGDGVLLNETTATEFIIALPPTSFVEGFDITVTDVYGETKFIETSKSNTVFRSSLLTMPEIVVNMLPSVSLSETGTANCYIVSEAGSYQFIPTKGNSSQSVGALGMLYQWDRKDPFLGSSSLTENVDAESTITWPPATLVSPSTGTVEYVTSHPTLYIKASSWPENWHYSGHVNTLWADSESYKSVYDPCPAGWRVPDGGINGVWAKALGSSSDFHHSCNNTDKGMNFSGKFGDDTTIWYPLVSIRGYSDGALSSAGYHASYWPSSSTIYSPYYFYMHYWGEVRLSGTYAQANGLSVRCVQEQAVVLVHIVGFMSKVCRIAPI